MVSKSVLFKNCWYFAGFENSLLYVSGKNSTYNSCSTNNKGNCTKIPACNPWIVENTFWITKVCTAGRHEITHGFAQILSPLWDKSVYLDLETYQIAFPKNFCIQLGRLMYEIWKIINSWILRKLGKCEKVAFFAVFPVIWIFHKIHEFFLLVILHQAKFVTPPKIECISQQADKRQGILQ
jgi:hypothetical protein